MRERSTTSIAFSPYLTLLSFRHLARRRQTPTSPAPHAPTAVSSRHLHSLFLFLVFCHFPLSVSLVIHQLSYKSAKFVTQRNGSGKRRERNLQQEQSTHDFNTLVLLPPSVVATLAKHSVSPAWRHPAPHRLTKKRNAACLSSRDARFGFYAWSLVVRACRDTNIFFTSPLLTEDSPTRQQQQIDSDATHHAKTHTKNPATRNRRTQCRSPSRATAPARLPPPRPASSSPPSPSTTTRTA